MRPGLVARQPGNVGDVLRIASARYGDREVLAYRGARWTYRAFNGRVNGMAQRLIDRGIARGDVVASIAYNSDVLLALYFALAKVGAVNVPLNTMLLADDVRDVVERSAAKMVVYGSECEDRTRGVGDVETVPLEEVEPASPGGEPPLAPGGDVPGMVIYTSGSTGRPKGCIKTHANLVWSAVNCQLETPRRLDGVELYVIPLAGVGFANFILPAVMAGSRIVLDRFDATGTLDLIQAERATNAFLAGTMLAAMLAVEDNGDYELGTLELVETAYQLSERLRDGIAERLGPIVRYCYGSTEGTNWAAPAEIFTTRPACVGFPKGFDEYRIVDDDGHELGPGEIGEVLVGGPTVMLGYLGDPEGTAASLSDGWLRTGDLGEIDVDGMMLFRGRKKDMIKTGGLNVAAGEVELALARHPDLGEVAVIGVDDEQWGEAVAAVVVPARAGVENGEFVVALQEHARNELAPFKRPKHYVVVRELPKNPTGKVAKGLLRETYGAGGAGAGSATSPFINASQKK
jgi:fatty-acyl-CoA synthase